MGCHLFICLLYINLSDTRKTQGVEGDVKEGSASHWEKGEGGVEGEGGQVVGVEVAQQHCQQSLFLSFPAHPLSARRWKNNTLDE